MFDEAFDEVALCDEIDRHQIRRSVGHTGAAEEGIDLTLDLCQCCVDTILAGQVDLNGLLYRIVDFCDIHHDHFAAEFGHCLGRSRTHSRCPAHDERALAIVSICVDSHVLLLVFYGFVIAREFLSKIFGRLSTGTVQRSPPSTRMRASVVKVECGLAR